MRGADSVCWLLFFFFNDTATTEIYTLSLHDALPIWEPLPPAAMCWQCWKFGSVDRKSTRLNSSHRCISYAVFCLKKKKKKYRKHKNCRVRYNCEESDLGELR